ncbi:hypothetical protein AB0H73_17830 [Streptomyces olivoreticuli]
MPLQGLWWCAGLGAYQPAFGPADIKARARFAVGPTAALDVA